MCATLGFACSRDQSPSDRVGSVRRDQCSERLATLRDHLAVSPREGSPRLGRSHRTAVPPRQVAPLDEFEAPYYAMNNKGVAWNVMDYWVRLEEPWLSATVDRLTTVLADYSSGVLLMHPDRETTLANLALARSVIARSEQHLGRQFDLRLLVDNGRYAASYDPPVVPTGWVRAAIDEIRATRDMWTALTKEALTRAAPGCPGAVMAGVTVVDEGQTERQPEQEERMLAELAACGCRAVDMDAFTGLMLGLVGYRNPLGWVRLATRPDAAHRVTLPRTATVQALVSAWPADAGDQPVWVEVE
ncbi:MAG: hypothetical protein KBG48_15630 [Kofleriaceae bacterium]|nr:hypothetical protein [Kofleriaceae bacterium]MBP9168828.1 hypothetical protein [Kofleriaceae bacterium]MBP9862399.1 hypothetical protein [Kofleriaceae bacterium]